MFWISCRVLYLWDDCKDSVLYEGWYQEKMDCSCGGIVVEVILGRCCCWLFYCCLESRDYCALFMTTSSEKTTFFIRSVIRNKMDYSCSGIVLMLGLGWCCWCFRCCLLGIGDVFCVCRG